MKQVLQSHHRRQENGSKRLLPRIGLVSIPYHPSLLLFSSFYRSRFQKRKQYGNYTERYVNIAGLIRGR